MLGGSCLILAIVVLTVLAQLMVRNKLGKSTLMTCHEVGGYYFSAVGTLYAVILGLVVVDSTGKFNEAREKTINEANALAEIYAMAEQMPREPRTDIKAAVRRYVDRALNEGWTHLQANGHDAIEEDDFMNIILASRVVEPETENQKALFPLLMSSLITASENREGRLNVEAYNIPGIEWFSLVVGGGITITFTFFFAIEHQRVQSAMAAMIAFVLALNLYIAFLFDSPFTGELQVSKEPFASLQHFISTHP